jgi:hypothetical protein
MFIYNVSIQLDKAIEQEWLNWMHQEHMDEVIATGMFDKYALFELIEPAGDPEEGLKTYIAQYETDSRERYQQYIDVFAPTLREKGFARFGSQFIAFRTIMRRC